MVGFPMESYSPESLRLRKGLLCLSLRRPTTSREVVLPKPKVLSSCWCWCWFLFLVLVNFCSPAGPSSNRASQQAHPHRRPGSPPTNGRERCVRCPGTGRGGDRSYLPYSPSGIANARQPHATRPRIDSQPPSCPASYPCTRSWQWASAIAITHIYSRLCL